MKLYRSTALAAVLMLNLSACQQQAADGSAPVEAAAASLEALSGTWKVDLASLKFEGKPNNYLLQDGTYSCSTCIPPLTTPADGAMHAVADRPYYDQISVKVVDDKTVEFKRMKDGREVSNSVNTVSDDGSTLTAKFNNMNVSGQTVSGTSVSKRVGPAPAGAHALSGQWQEEQIPEYSEEARNISFQVAGDQVTMNSAGESYTATIEGPEVAIQGDNAGTMVKLSKEGAAGLRETFLRDGKEVGVSILTPSADGKSVTAVYTDPRDGSKTTWTAAKQ